LINKLPERERFLRGLRAWTGFRQTGIKYERSPRAAGETKYTFRKLVKLAFDGMFGFSRAPLTMILYFGILVSSLSIFLGLVYISAKLFDFPLFGVENTPAGFTTVFLRRCSAYGAGHYW
jgi:dolichol-phosphate mannosyltransferase